MCVPVISLLIPLLQNWIVVYSMSSPLVQLMFYSYYVLVAHIRLLCAVLQHVCASHLIIIILRHSPILYYMCGCSIVFDLCGRTSLCIICVPVLMPCTAMCLSIYIPVYGKYLRPAEKRCDDESTMGMMMMTSCHHSIHVYTLYIYIWKKKIDDSSDMREVKCSTFQFATFHSARISPAVHP